MGCDIHMLTEVRDPKTGKWKKTGAIFKDWQGQPTDLVYQTRDYDLFGLLADVRNPNKIEPIKSPTHTLPEDVSEEIRTAFEAARDAAHIKSYYTLRELLNFNFIFPIRCRGMISPEQIVLLNKGIPPTSYCGWTNKEGWEEREWTAPFRSSFVTEVIPALKKLGRPDDVRIVFWFSD